MFPSTNMQAMDGPITGSQKKRPKPVVPESTITTRSRVPSVTEAGASDTPARPDGDNTEGDTSPMENATSKDSKSPNDNQIVTTQDKGINDSTSLGLLLVSCQTFL